MEMKKIFWGLELEMEGCPRMEKSDSTTWFGNDGKNYGGFHGELKVTVVLNGPEQIGEKSEGWKVAYSCWLGKTRQRTFVKMAL